MRAGAARVVVARIAGARMVVKCILVLVEVEGLGWGEVWKRKFGRDLCTD
jgi:hypothetical protein